MRTGILAIDKAEGERSTSCVSFVRRLLGRGSKVGHAGTLDSPASGVLLLLTGGATRLSSYMMLLPKVYLVEAQFGRRTSTDDAAGEVVSEAPVPSRERLLAVLRGAYAGFLGCRMQVPPRISAVHVEGERAHDLARQGRAFDIKPRPVSIWSIQEAEVPPGDEAAVCLRIGCSKGTYIRSFVRDLGDIVGCGAHVKSLRRLNVGGFAAEGAVTTERLGQGGEAALRQAVMPLGSLTRHFLTYEASGETGRLVAHGSAVPLRDLGRCWWGSVSPECGVFVLADGVLAGGRVIERNEAYFQPDVVIPLQGDETA